MMVLMKCNSCKYWVNPKNNYAECHHPLELNNFVPVDMSNEISKLNTKTQKDEIRWFRNYENECNGYSKYYSTNEGFSCNNWKIK